MEDSVKLLEEMHSTLGKMECALSLIEDSIFWTNSSGQIEWCNDSFTSLIQQPKAAVIGKEVGALLPLMDCARHPIEEVIETGSPFKRVCKFNSSDGNRFLAIYAKYISPTKGLGGNQGLAICALRDVTKEHRQHQELQEKERLLATRASDLKKAKKYKKAQEEIHSLAQFAQENPDPVLRISLDGMLIYANRASQRLINILKCKVGHSLFETALGPHIEAATLGKHEAEIEFSFDRYTYLFKLVPQIKSGYINIYGIDITKRKEAEEKLGHLARFDILTNLPNRFYFEESLKRTIAQCKRGHLKNLAILLLDIDNFKIINDTLGHVMGDLLLQQFSKRILKTVRQEDFVARIGGDEFILITSGTKAIEPYAVRLLQALTGPIRLHNRIVNITASMGIAIYPLSGRTPGVLTKNADIALYLAKEKGKHTYQIHNNRQNIQYSQRLKLETYIRTALKRNKFFLLYQPQFDVQSKKICGVEALLRLKHPSGKVILPNKFIHLIEKMGLITAVGEFVLRTACEQYVKWKTHAKIDFPLSVNVSPFQLSLPFIDNIYKTLQETKMKPKDLVIEITESTLVTYIDSQKVLKKIHKLGVQIAIDDFGTGHSSLSRLKDFPVDRIKIDRSFISGLPKDKNNITITKSIIDLSKNLGVSVIAEGVETSSQLEFLQKNKCPFAQGFYFSKPIAGANLSKLFRALK
jgi:diguanylate cyclase (GGDEF)-like protein